MTDAPLSNARLLHTMLRVSNLDISLDFYCQKLGMRLLRRQDFSPQRFTLVFLGYGSEDETAVIELTHNWDQTDYNHGTAYGHIALGITDLAGVCQTLKNTGVPIIRQPGEMAFGDDKQGPRDVIAFIADPDGYKIELIERP